MPNETNTVPGGPINPQYNVLKGEKRKKETEQEREKRNYTANITHKRARLHY